MDNKSNTDSILNNQGSNLYEKKALGKGYDVNEVSGAGRTFLSNVFSWMFLGLMISGVVALAVATNPNLFNAIFQNRALSMVVIFSPLAFVLLMSFGYNKLSFPVLTTLFLVYAAIMGLSLSFIFLMYTGSSIALTFGIASVTFGIMAVTGYRTSTDLSNFGSILRMLLIGLVIAMLVNLFLHSAALDYLMSFVGVAVFTGLTAYDVQRLKLMAAEGTSPEEGRKLAVMGALKLYLDFVNLFLFLLRLFGRRR